MTSDRRQVLHAATIVAACLPLAVACPMPVAATTVPRAITRAFDFPASLANGVAGNLVPPSDGVASLQFQLGLVGIGFVPVPRPEPFSRLSRARGRLSAPVFMSQPDAVPHARLLLRGVTGPDGMPASGNGTLIIDAVISPATAGQSPFSLPFQIQDGMAFLDVALPIQPQPDQAVHVETRGVTVQDGEGQAFGVLGFTVAAAANTTPTPVGTPSVEGECFVGPNCMGPSFSASREKCCRFIRPLTVMSEVTSWCPPDQFDPSSGKCAANACVSCVLPADCGERPDCGGPCKVTCDNGQVAVGSCQENQGCSCVADCTPAPTETPAPTRTPGPCETSSDCTGSCPFTCPDGTTITGQCTILLTPGQPNVPRGPICACEGDCPQPPTPTLGPSECVGGRDSCGGPCSGTCSDGSPAAGKCVPLIFNGPLSPPGSKPVPPAFGCQCSLDCPPGPTPTSGPCDPAQGCSGTCSLTCADGSTATGECLSTRDNLCGCSATCRPGLPHGTICCQCGAPANKCFDIRWVEVAPTCPDGCETITGGTCDESTGTCARPTACTQDSDCNDGNGCTVDRCDGGVCEHDCLCVAPGACRPGPAAMNPQP